MMRSLLIFLSELACHNDREWFMQNKPRYDVLRREFEQFSTDYITRLSQIDPSIQELTAKDCIWRIYRDVRFSADKRPYKEWFGVFPAAPVPGKPHSGGKHSEHAGYYLHIQPGHCLFAGGIWCPSPELLRALRREILANYDEVADIMHTAEWKTFFGDFDTDNMLKKIPSEFAPELAQLQTTMAAASQSALCQQPDQPSWATIADWVKRKSFTYSTPLSDEDICSPNLLDHLMDIAKAAKPMNDFLNYTFEA